MISTVIFPDQLESIGDPVIPPDAPFYGKRFDAFKELAAVAKAHGSLLVAQVSHPGRQSHVYFQKNPVAASDIPFDDSGPRRPLKFATPHAATEQEIAEIIQSFAHAAEYLEKAGFDGIEIHGAHGFLLSGFLSPKTNKRIDKYGGPLENRMRIILEVDDAIRARVPSTFIVGIKINSTEFQDTGFTTVEAARLCAELEAHHFDFVELSGGSSENLLTEHKRASTINREAYFLEFAEEIAPGLMRTRTYITGGLRTVGGMVRALNTVDGVGLGRPLCQEFDLCKNILDGKVLGTIIPKVGQGEFWLALMAGNRQIREVGQGKEPLELWEEDVVEDLRRGYDTWIENKSSDHEFVSYYGVSSTEAMENGTVPPFTYAIENGSV